MAEEILKGVHQPITLKGRRRRSLDERIYLRFPPLVSFLSALIWRLPPRSRVRRAFLLRSAHLGFDALNRKDFESSFLLYEADFEFITPPRLVGLGFDPVYRGRDGRIEFQRRWMDEWGEMRFVPEEVFDLGDRAVFLGSVKGSGATSGAGFESDQWGVVYDLSAGRLTRERPFFDRQEALDAAGLTRAPV